jgi:hypothetical protein
MGKTTRKETTMELGEENVLIMVTEDGRKTCGILEKTQP